MCVESHWGLSANYRLKSDREKLEGKGTAARCCGWQREEEKGEGGGGWFLAKSSNPLLKAKNKIQSSWCPSHSHTPSQHNPVASIILWDKRSGVSPRWDHHTFHGTSHLFPELMPFPKGSLASNENRTQRPPRCESTKTHKDLCFNTIWE